MSLNKSDNEIVFNIISEKKEYIQGKLNVSDYNENNTTMVEIIENITEFQGVSQPDSTDKPFETSSVIIHENKEIPVERNNVNLENVEKNEENEDILEIKKEKNYIFFFLLACGHDPTPFCEKIDTKIGTIIDKYIKNMDEKEEIRYTFYYKDKKIDDMNKTIRELEIEHLGFLHAKPN